MVPAAGCWAKHGAVDYEPRFFQALAGQDQSVETYLVVKLNVVNWSALWSYKPCQHVRDNQGIWSYPSAGCAQHWFCSLISIRQCMSYLPCAGAAGYEIMNLSLHRPAYQWSSDEVRTFWELLDDLLARVWV